MREDVRRRLSLYSPDDIRQAVKVIRDALLIGRDTNWMAKDVRRGGWVSVYGDARFWQGTFGAWAGEHRQRGEFLAGQAYWIASEIMDGLGMGAYQRAAGTYRPRRMTADAACSS